MKTFRVKRAVYIEPDKTVTRNYKTGNNVLINKYGITRTTKRKVNATFYER